MPYIKNKKGKNEYLNPNKPMPEGVKRVKTPAETGATFTTPTETGGKEAIQGVRDPKTGALVNPISDEERARRAYVSNKLNQVSMENDVNKALLNQPLAQNQMQQTATITEEAANNASTLLNTPEKPFLEPLRKTLTPNLPPQKAPNLLKPVVAVYDLVQSAFKQGKSIKQQEAEATFTDIKNTMNYNLQLLRTTGDPELQANIENDLVLAEATLERMESVNKGMNKANIRYLLTDGKDVQTQLILWRNMIDGWKLQTQSATQEGTLKRLRGGL